MIGMSPKDAIKLKEVTLADNYTLPEDGLYHYLLQPGEEHDDQRKRATDMIRSKKTYRLREIVEDSGNGVMYYLKDGSDRASVSEDLMLLKTQSCLPITFKNGNIYPNMVKILIKLDKY